MSDHTPESVWHNFWKEICTDSSGNVDLEQIKKELYDFYTLMNNVPKVYDHVTGGRISKIMTDPDAVIREADDSYRQSFDDLEDERQSELFLENLFERMEELMTLALESYEINQRDWEDLKNEYLGGR